LTQNAINWLSDAKTTVEWLRPQDIAGVVAYTAELPRHVNLEQITVMPTKQAN
jgi:NADP-dependent 3-hydroxy acid dehydrogenase YdfG